MTTPTTYTTFAALAADLAQTGRLFDVRITYVLAKDILTNGQCINRRINASKVSGQARDLVAGAWNRKKLGTFDVMIEAGGRPRFADGQHRLRCLIEAVEVLGATDPYLDVCISTIDSLRGQDEGTPRTVRDHLELMGRDGALIAPALMYLFKHAAKRGGTITEYLEFFDKKDNQDLLIQTAQQVQRWLAEAKTAGVKPPIKAAELSITRVLSMRGNSGPGVEVKIDELLHDMALGAATNPNVASLLEFFDDNAATKQGKKLELLQNVVTQTINGITLTQAQIARFTKKPKRAKKTKAAAAVETEVVGPLFPKRGRQSANASASA